MFVEEGFILNKLSVEPNALDISFRFYLS